MGRIGPFELILIFSILFMVLLFLAGIIVIVYLLRRTTNRNGDFKILTVDALVVSKRLHYYGGRGHTTYYVTFQVESGDRMELCLSGEEYGMLVEGDRGSLTFQGTRYLGFERK